MRAFAAVLIFIVLSALPAAAAKRIALVIGNSDYGHVVDLKNPVNDADLMEKTLKDVGFDVTRLNNLDQRGMKQAMLEFGRKLKEGAEASMFYYAGHGIEVNGTNYLVPVDADTRSIDEADIQNVSVNSFLSLTENSSVPLNIVILDACRNNPFRSLRSGATGGLAPVKAPRGTYVAYATAPGAVAVDGDADNSPFTLALAESIKQPGLSLEAVLKLTRAKVQTATNGAQLPFDSSAITGDFFFVPVVAQTPAPEAPKLFQLDTAQEAYQAAGDDPDLLRVVIDKFGDTVWAALAREKLKKLGATQKPQSVPQAETPETPDTPEAIVPKPSLASPPVTTNPPATEEVAEPETPVVTPAPAVQSNKAEEKKKITAPPRKAKVVVKAKPPVRVKPVVVRKPKAVVRKPIVEKKVRAANYPICGTTPLSRGAMCRTMGGQVCRVAGRLMAGSTGGSLILRGCR